MTLKELNELLEFLKHTRQRMFNYNMSTAEMDARILELEDKLRPPKTTPSREWTGCCC